LLKLKKESAGGLSDSFWFCIEDLLDFYFLVCGLVSSIVKNVGLGAAGSSILGF
jgi:hypothetical protein